MRCFGEDTGEKRHYRSRRIQEDHGQGMESVSSDTAWFSPLLMIRFFWRFLDSLHSFHKDLLGAYSVPDTFIHGTSGDQMETIAIMSWKHAFPSVIGKYVPNTKLQRRQEISVSIGSPLTAHPITRYLLPSQVAAVFSMSTVCFVLFWF